MERERTPVKKARGAHALRAVAELPTDRAFVLQLTHDSGPGLAAFAGRLEHLTSGRRARFGTMEEFLAALGRLLGERQQP